MRTPIEAGLKADLILVAVQSRIILFRWLKFNNTMRTLHSIIATLNTSTPVTFPPANENKEKMLTTLYLYVCDYLRMYFKGNILVTHCYMINKEGVHHLPP
jgi:hypothetical protein